MICPDRIRSRLTVDLIHSVAVGCHDGTAGEVKNSADCSTGDKQPSTTETINEWQDGTGGNKEDDVLDDGGSQGSVATLERG